MKEQEDEEEEKEEKPNTQLQIIIPLFLGFNRNIIRENY